MVIYKMKDYEAMSRKAASILAAQITLKPDSVLGLATGSSPGRHVPPARCMVQERGFGFFAGNQRKSGRVQRPCAG